MSAIAYICHRDNFTETEPHHLVSEASDLGFPVGRWPTELSVPGVGNGQLFFLQQMVRDEEHELLFTTYRQQLGCVTLKIFND